MSQCLMCTLYDNKYFWLQRVKGLVHYAIEIMFSASTCKLQSIFVHQVISEECSKTCSNISTLLQPGTAKFIYSGDAVTVGLSTNAAIFYGKYGLCHFRHNNN